MPGKYGANHQDIGNEFNAIPILAGGVILVLIGFVVQAIQPLLQLVLIAPS
jgi:hypothetical protein